MGFLFGARTVHTVALFWLLKPVQTSLLRSKPVGDQSCKVIKTVRLKAKSEVKRVWQHWWLGQVVPDYDDF